jgi:carbonic anhydrase/acetyltransferase-like protein (isoleucine patch superfamily)
MEPKLVRDASLGQTRSLLWVPKIPPGSLVLGSPAKLKRALTHDEQKHCALGLELR